jgi:predicted ATP-grasp superfamily ATP-dependent carboligase
MRGSGNSRAWRVPVVLVGLDTIQGLQAARIYAARGVPVIGVASDRRYYTTKTNVCDDIVFFDGADLVDVLIDLARDLPEKPFLLPCHDNHVATISAGRDRLAEHYVISLPPDDVVKTLLDKTAFAELGSRIGMAVPPTWVIAKGDDRQPEIPPTAFPVAVKPSLRTGRWMSAIGEKAVRIDDATALADVLPRARAATDSVIIQPWVDGEDGDLFSCNGVFRDGVPLATFTARKIRQWPPRAGQSCLGEEVRCEEVLRETLTLASAVGYTGMLYLETKRDPRTGRHTVIEPNVGRPTGRSAIAEAGGVDLLLTAYCAALGLELPTGREQRFTGVKWIHLLRDLRSAAYYLRHRELTVGEWWRSVRGPKAFAIWSVRDPMPFVYAVMSVMRGVS